MRTVTEKTAQANAPTTSPETHNPMLSIADASEIKHVLEELFYAYVWHCTGRSEEEHETICFVYHGLLGLLDRSPENN